MADVDPRRARQFGHHVGRNLDGSIGGAGSRHHFAILFKRQVTIDRQGRGQAEWAYTAYRMTGHRNNLLWPKHARFRSKMIPEFAVIQPFCPGGNDEKNEITRLQADRFGNLVGVNAMRLGRECDGCRTGFRLDHGDFGRLLGKKGSDRFNRHAYFLGVTTSRFKVPRASYAFSAMLRCDEASVF
ncbi:hypothetical protein AT6N2_C2482 [Agrobacterium tumefaciens]|nr:hypothetical protein AT6N2_C2482 [Agrobacterium tumefaciens]